MILAMPVVDFHQMTETMLEHLAKSVRTDSPFKVVIVDNGSDAPYRQADYEGKYPFEVDVINYKKNRGFYYPLIEIFEEYSDPLIGLVHNDLMIYEEGWNKRMADAFEADPKLGLVGLTGSRELDNLGGRGAGTMCYFRGAEVKVGDVTYTGQSQEAGQRIMGVEPAVVLDSLFMMFRREVIPHLVTGYEKWENLTLAHFYDRIWPCRTIEAGYRVAVMGVECDHIGGITTTGNERYRQDCIDWLRERELPFDNPETEMYLIAERRFLNEYKEQKHFLPAIIDSNWDIRHLYGT